MRKILFSLMAIVLAVGVVGAGAFAWYSDTETSTGNVFTAGTLDLQVDGQNPVGMIIEIANAHPSYYVQGIYDIVLHNSGSVDGIADLHFWNVVNYENGRNEPELVVDTTGGNPGAGAGELGANMVVAVRYDLNADGSFTNEEIILDYTLLDDLDCEGFDLGPLPAESSRLLQIKVLFYGPGDHNDCQSDSVVFDIEFTLHQDYSAA